MSLDFLNKLGAAGGSDAFGRLRTSDPYTLFDYQSQYDAGPLLWEDATAGSGTATHVAAEAAVDLTVTTASGDKVTRQSRQYNRYQPGKSQLVFVTFVMGPGQANTDQRVGYFDDDNGIFLELSGTALQIVRRTKTSGSVVDNEVAQADWNVSSLSSLDITKAQIFVIDLEWLGVGSVRCGFVIDGQVKYVHQFNNANNLDLVYMATANLPVRYEIENTGTAAAGATLQAICASVISEGGFEADRGLPFSAGTGGTLLGVTTRVPVLSIRPKATFNSIVNRGSVVIGGVNSYAESTGAFFEVVYGGTLTGASFSSVDSNSIVESDTSASAISGGHTVISFFVPASTSRSGDTNPGAATLGLLSRLPLVLDKAGANPINLSLVATRIGGTGTANCGGSIFWQELR